jgi:WD40 repeat protein
VAFSPDGSLVASGSQGKTIKFWAVESGKRVDPVIEQDAAVNSLAFSPHHALLASGTDDAIITLWEFSSRQPVQ